MYEKPKAKEIMKNRKYRVVQGKVEVIGSLGEMVHVRDTNGSHFINKVDFHSGNFELLAN